MDAFIAKAKDVEKAQSLLQAVIDGNFGALRKRIEDGAECGLERQDVEPQALLMDGAGTAMFAMLNLHAPEKALNAPLYFAAFRGEAVMVNYLLHNTPYDQDTLNAALYGAVAAGSKALVTRLIDEGADASCGDGACVAASIAHKNEDITALLLAAGKSYTAALAAYIDQGKTEHVIDLLAAGAEPLDALKSVCRQLSDYSAARDRRRDGDYNDAFDIILSYATGHGDDIPQLLHHTMTYAVDRGAISVIDKIVHHAEFLKLPGRQTHLDAAMHFLTQAAFGGFNPAMYPGYDALSEKLLDLGANAQMGLERGVLAWSETIVAAALKHGADPRRNGRAALRHSSSENIQTLVRAAAEQLDAHDYAAFREQGDLTVEKLKAVAPGAGRTGLAAAAAAGEMAQALTVFRREGVDIAPVDLTRKGPDGYSALDALCDKGQAGVLLEPSLWLLRETDYAQVFEKMPKTTQGELGERHAEVLSRLSSHRISVQLKNQAEAHRKRFRPK